MDTQQFVQVTTSLFWHQGLVYGILISVALVIGIGFAYRMLMLLASLDTRIAGKFTYNDRAPKQNAPVTENNDNGFRQRRKNKLHPNARACLILDMLSSSMAYNSPDSNRQVPIKSYGSHSSLASKTAQKIMDNVVLTSVPMDTVPMSIQGHCGVYKPSESVSCGCSSNYSSCARVPKMNDSARGINQLPVVAINADDMGSNLKLANISLADLLSRTSTDYRTVDEPDELVRSDKQVRFDPIVLKNPTQSGVLKRNNSKNGFQLSPFTKLSSNCDKITASTNKSVNITKSKSESSGASVSANPASVGMSIAPVAPVVDSPVSSSSILKSINNPPVISSNTDVDKAPEKKTLVEEEKGQGKDNCRVSDA